MSKFKGLLEKIESCLQGFGLPVYYGRTFAKDNDEWNYFIFNRQSLNKSGTSGVDINYQYQVHIVMENYVEEDFEIEVIKTIQEKTRLKLTGIGQYSYATKGNTDIVVEMLTLTFTRTAKGIEL